MLLGRSIDGIAALDAAVADLLAMGAPAVLLKGGHLSGDLVMDVLGRQGQQASDYLRLQSQRIVTITAMARAARFRRRLPPSWPRGWRWKPQ